MPVLTRQRICINALLYAASAAAAVVSFFNGTAADAAVVFALGAGAYLLDLRLSQSQHGAPILNFVLSFGAGFASRVAAKGASSCIIPVGLAALLPWMPGLPLVQAFCEIIQKSLVAGTTRFMHAMISAMQMGFGFSVGVKTAALMWEGNLAAYRGAVDLSSDTCGAGGHFWRLPSQSNSPLEPPTAPATWLWMSSPLRGIALFCTLAGYASIIGASVRQMPLLFLAAFAALAINFYSEPVFGPFAGAALAAACSGLVASAGQRILVCTRERCLRSARVHALGPALADRPDPALIFIFLAVLILVPGTIGVKGAAQMFGGVDNMSTSNYTAASHADSTAVSAGAFTLQMLGLGLAQALGLTLAGAVCGRLCQRNVPK